MIEENILIVLDFLPCIEHELLNRRIIYNAHLDYPRLILNAPEFGSTVNKSVHRDVLIK